MSRNGEVLKHNIVFSMMDLELPSPRDYHYFEYYQGDSYIRLEKLSMDVMRKEFTSRKNYEMPPVLGNKKLLELWVENMCEAMYNPLWMRRFEDHKKGYKLGIFDGHHRLRLFDALGANYIWGFIQNVRHMETPTPIMNIRKLNMKEPNKGTKIGVCTHCGQKTRWTFKRESGHDHRLLGAKMICLKCDKENPYPWPGRL